RARRLYDGSRSQVADRRSRKAEVRHRADRQDRFLTRMPVSGAAALVTGGKRIGAAIARTLAAAGMDVALSYNTSRADAEGAAAGRAGPPAARHNVRPH